MSRYLINSLQSLEAYTPGEQPRKADIIKLNTNESPYPPSAAVLKAAAEEAGRLHLYSDPVCASVRDAIAGLWGVTRDNVLAFNGSDDVLNYAFLAFAGRGGKVYFPDISYGFYPVYGNLHGTNWTAIPLKNDFSINPKDYYGLDGMVVIANPNAPTGIALSVEELEGIIASNPDHVVLIDEAYVDFGAESCIPLTAKYDNLLVSQTFSKSRCLAGGRLGFAVAESGLIDDLDRVRCSTNPYNVNRMTLAAGTAAIRDNDYYMANCEKIMKTREQTAARLRRLGFDILPSKANFLFAKSKKIGGEALYLELKKRGILVRHFSGKRICDYNRITIGTEEQMDALIKAIEEIQGA